MNVPNVIIELIKAQNQFNSSAYANCFSKTAVVTDEGSTYNGKAEIREWIEKANLKYKAVIKALEYSSAEEMLTAEVSGNFAGSPLVLTYDFGVDDGLIQALTITG